MQENLPKDDLTEVKDTQDAESEDKSKESSCVSLNTAPQEAQTAEANGALESEQDKDLSLRVSNDDSLERFYKLIKDFFAYPGNDKPTNTPPEQEEQDFSKAFPGVERQKVESDPDFLLFKGSREQNKGTVSLYKDFLELSASIERKVTERLLAKNATNRSSVGSLSSSERIDGDYFTKEHVLKMSEEQIRRNFDKIRRSQARW